MIKSVVRSSFVVRKLTHSELLTLYDVLTLNKCRLILFYKIKEGACEEREWKVRAVCAR